MRFKLLYWIKILFSLLFLCFFFKSDYHIINYFLFNKYQFHIIGMKYNQFIARIISSFYFLLLLLSITSNDMICIFIIFCFDKLFSFQTLLGIALKIHNEISIAPADFSFCFLNIKLYSFIKTHFTQHTLSFHFHELN